VNKIKEVAISAGIVGLVLLVALIGLKIWAPAGKSLVIRSGDFIVRDLFGSPQERLAYFVDQIKRPRLTNLNVEVDGDDVRIEAHTDGDALLTATLDGPNGTQTLFSGKRRRVKWTERGLPDGRYTLTITPYREKLIPHDLAEALGRTTDRRVSREGYSEYREFVIDRGLPNTVPGGAVIDTTIGDDGSINEVVIVTLRDNDLSGLRTLRVGSFEKQFSSGQIRAEVPAPIANGHLFDGFLWVKLVDQAGNTGNFKVPIDTHVRNGTVLLDPDGSGRIQGVGTNAECFPIMGCPPGYVRVHIQDSQITGVEEFIPEWYWGSAIATGVILASLGIIAYLIGRSALDRLGNITFPGPGIQVPES